MLPQFDDPEIYASVLDALTRKWAARGRLDRLEVAGLSLAALRGRTRPLAKLLAKTVASGNYRYAPLTPVEAYIGGKTRTLYRPNLLDRIVLTVVARYLGVLAEPCLSPVLHSYRKGHSAFKAIATFRDHLLEHRDRVPLRERGLYVLRRDVARYGESIATEPSSTLWTSIERVLALDPETTRRQVGKALVAGAILQPVLASEGEAAPLPRGVPTGSPIQPVCTNLYLMPVDEYCCRVAGAFYSRFGDDILFAHPDATAAREASLRIDELLQLLGLTSKLEKRCDIDFNGAGRKRDPDVAFRPCNQLEYLGASLDFAGNIALKQKKATELQRTLRERLFGVTRTLADSDTKILVAALCETVRVSFEADHPLSLRQSDFMRHLATQRGQLRDLDYRIALTIAELASGRRGPRAFRAIPYRELRRSGLPSLVRSRDRASTKGKSNGGPSSLPTLRQRASSDDESGGDDS